MPETQKKQVFIKTYGCQMNERDSAAMEVLLAQKGYQLVSTPDKADLILYNTCTIRDKAYHKAMSDIGRSREHKEMRGTKIGICGCAAQQSKGELLKRFDHIDFVLGPDQIATLPRVVDDAFMGKRSGETELIDDPGRYVFVDGASDERIQSGSAFVTIMKGCNYACSYCIVPSVRGREVCRSSDEILAEIKRLIERGIHEVTLLGQNVADYKELESAQKRSLAWLVKRIAYETNIRRIRFTSPHPRDIDDDLIATYGTEKSLCGHIHLPLQAGNNRILKQMHRGYTRERYLELVEKLRLSCPEIAITTDIIVGFPTESREEFEETLDIVRRVEFDGLYAFSYSPRPGTHAAMYLQESLDEEEKRARLNELLDVQRGISHRKNEAFVGTTCEVLVTGADKRDSLLTGRSLDNRIVHFQGERSLIGSLVPVEIHAAGHHSLEGEYIHV